MRGVGGGRKSIHPSCLAKGLGFWVTNVEVLKAVRDEIMSEEASTLQIGSVAFPPGQCTSPQLHPCHRLFDQYGHGDSSTPSQSSQKLLPGTFAYYLKLRSCRYETNWGDERGCDEGYWHAHTRGLPWSLPEVVGTVQVHCSRRRLLRRGQEFHLCIINKSTYTKKVWETYMLLVYIY